MSQFLHIMKNSVKCSSCINTQSVQAQAHQKHSKELWQGHQLQSNIVHQGCSPQKRGHFDSLNTVQEALYGFEVILEARKYSLLYWYFYHVSFQLNYVVLHISQLIGFIVSTLYLHTWVPYIYVIYTGLELFLYWYHLI